jgi:NADH-quinone oxidoreductase subunit N
MITFAVLPMEITAPKIEYGLLAPVLVIFAAACLGVLAEALAPREIRRVVQLVIAFVSLALALVTTVLNWAAGDEAVVAVNSLALDGPTYFMWTILIIFSAAALLMFAETKIESASVFAPQAAAVPGTVAEREAIRSRVEHTEVFPLALFAVLGMMLFPASNDLITMFVSLEILSLPLYLLCGLARRRRLLSQ